MLKLGLNIKKVVFLSCFVEGKFKSLVKCWLEAVRRIYIGLYTKGAQLEPFQGGIGGAQLEPFQGGGVRGAHKLQHGYQRG